MIIIVFLFIFLIIFFYIINKYIIIEKFYVPVTTGVPVTTRNYDVPVTTWTPYIIDKDYQPGYSNYFYNNGYMYPIY